MTQPIMHPFRGSCMATWELIAARETLIVTRVA
jgi:hypothetical protein